jgi:hypothetical protein
MGVLRYRQLQLGQDATSGPPHPRVPYLYLVDLVVYGSVAAIELYRIYFLLFIDFDCGYAAVCN